MIKQKSLTLIFSLFLLFNPLIVYSLEKPSIGAFLKPINEKQYMVIGLYPKSEAKKKGMKVGDIIVRVDGKEMGLRESLHYAQTKKSGDVLLLTVLREGKERNFKIPLREVDFKYDAYSHAYAIDKLLLDGHKVSVIVAPGKIEFIGPTTGFDIESWKRSSGSVLISAYEPALIGTFSDDPNFKLINRSAISNILEEINFQQTGYVADDARVKIGKLTGATHMLILGYSRHLYTRQKMVLIFPTQQLIMSDVMTIKLIDVETGKILSSSTIYNEVDAQAQKPIRSSERIY